MLRSALFRDDPILESVANDLARVSRNENNVHGTVQRVQLGLLARRPDCLPTFGADEDETAGAVLQLKVDEWAAVRSMIEPSGDVTTMGLGERGPVVGGGLPVKQALAQLVGNPLDAVVTPNAPELRGGPDPVSAELTGAWLAMRDQAQSRGKI